MILDCPNVGDLSASDFIKSVFGAVFVEPPKEPPPPVLPPVILGCANDGVEFAVLPVFILEKGEDDTSVFLRGVNLVPERDAPVLNLSK